MTIRFFNIVWDSDNADAKLPTETILEVPADCDVEMEGADILSDQFGYCVHGFDFEQC